ncbi:hypothetical protein AV530_013920 [Patagioenas fasciata monilis]|uniref:Uncharacterized protein n=1 Tax=Patagioenas fasciata monilis TaxID=372326 RepID=A0A1V4KN04_PATFA|nr:hypothetical protein AV530_013920 [Patagioenas fasciata monilis]
MDEANPSPNYLKVKLEKADQQPSDLPGCDILEVHLATVVHKAINLQAAYKECKNQALIALRIWSKKPASAWSS